MCSEPPDGELRVEVPRPRVPPGLHRHHVRSPARPAYGRGDPWRPRETPVRRISIEMETRFPGRSLTVCLRSISVSVQDGLLYQPDIMALLIAEFNFPDDAGTDGVLDGAMDQFAQFDADANGSIDANEFIGLWYGLQRNPQRHSRDGPDRLLVFSLEIRNHFSGFPLESTLPPPALPSLNDQELAQKFDLYLLRHIFVKTLKENPFFRVSSSVIKRFRSAKKLNFRLLLFKYSRFLG